MFLSAEALTCSPSFSGSTHHTDIFQAAPRRGNQCILCNLLLRYSTVIRYHLPRDAYVKLRVFDVKGRLLRTLMDEREKAGYKALNWDGRLNDGRRAASGIYLYELNAETFRACKKMLMVR